MTHLTQQPCRFSRLLLLAVISCWSVACAGRADDRARHVMTSFRQGDQGDTGNCASIAAIKAALYKWGTDGVFASRTVGEEGRIHVRMRDGAEFELERGFLEAVKKEAGFIKETDEALWERANEAYAAMALRLARDFRTRCFAKTFREDQLALLEGRETPTPLQALKILNGGIHVQRAPELLGIAAAQERKTGGRVTRYFTTRSFLGDRPACVANSGSHAWFVSRQVADRYGADVDMFSPLDWFRACGGFRLSGGYCLEDAAQPPVDECQATGTR